MSEVIRRVGPVALAAAFLTTAIFVVGLHAAETKFGDGVKLTTATSIKELYASPAKFIGKTIRLDGVVTDVCDEMGCWLAIADAADHKQVVRFQAEHDGAIVFPMTLKGKAARAEGVFTEVSPGAPKFEDRYEIKVTGAVAP